MSTDKQVSLQSLIPPKVLKKIAGKKVIETSFGAGPACCAGKVESLAIPIEFEQGMEFLERFRRAMTAGCLVFEGGSRLWFRWDKFERYVPGSIEDRPSPGVELGDLTNPRFLKLCGLKRKGNKMVAADGSGWVYSEYTHEEMKIIEERLEEKRLLRKPK
jgi:hypothetical protein